MRNVATVVLLGFASCALLWFGTGLHPIWWLTWFAPLPVLWMARRLPRGATFCLAFGAWTIGACNEWKFLHDFIELPLAILLAAILLPGLIFALDVVLWRRFILRNQPALAATAFASLWVVYEFAMQSFSPHATSGSLAYSQMDCLPILQVASVTGLSGISFLLFFTASALAGRSVRVAGVALGVLGLTAAWGFHRLADDIRSGHEVRVALIATDVKEYLFPKEGPVQERLFEEYGTAVEDALRQGATLVVLPEKLARVSEGARGAFAREGVTIAFGLETASGGKKFNEEVVHSPQGDLLYRKHHMVPGFESHLTSGTERVTLDMPSGKWGFEICKDLDFPRLSRAYGEDGVGLLVVPAWDFVLDDWLHDRMAVARGVESGFTIVRAAKQGLLTVSDSWGRILAERPSKEGTFSTLIATAPVLHVNTLYARWGDWFAWLNVLGLATMLSYRR